MAVADSTIPVAAKAQLPAQVPIVLTAVTLPSSFQLRGSAFKALEEVF